MIQHFSWKVLTKCNRVWPSLDLQLKPILLYGIKQVAGNTLTGMLPARTKYAIDDVRRIAEYYEVEYEHPQDAFNVINKGSLKAQRLLIASKANNPEYLEELSRQLFRGIWLKHEDITEDYTLQEACHASNVPGELSVQLLDMIKHDEVKNELKAATEKAIEIGVFGVPFLVFEHSGKIQMMFGTDRMFLLAHYLGEKWPPS